MVGVHSTLCVWFYPTAGTLDLFLYVWMLRSSNGHWLPTVACAVFGHPGLDVDGDGAGVVCSCVNWEMLESNENGRGMMGYHVFQGDTRKCWAWQRAALGCDEEVECPGHMPRDTGNAGPLNRHQVILIHLKGGLIWYHGGRKLLNSLLYY